MKKILTTLLLVVFFWPSLALGVANLPYGSECSSDPECASGGCEKAKNGAISGKSFCDCGDNLADDSDDEYCRTEFQSQYPEANEADWKCVGGTAESGDLDYCQNGSIAKYPAGIQSTEPPSFSDTAGKTVEGAALTENELNNMLSKPEPRIKIPGLEFSNTSVGENKVTEPDGSIYLVFPFLGEYLAAIYKYILIVISIISVIILIVAGFQWAIPDASGENINSAKNRIAGALSGLIIAVGSYAILYAVNPELVQFRSLRVRYIESVDLADYTQYPSDPGVDDAGGTPANQAGGSNLDSGKIAAAKGQNCGQNLVSIAEAYAGQTICQGPCHCANFVSRVLAQSGCSQDFKSDSAPSLKNRLIKLGWQLNPNTNGVEPGDIVFWGNPNEKPGHVEIAYNSAGQSIGSSVNMTACWGGKAKEVEKTCGPFWSLGYYGGEKNTAAVAKFGYSGDKLNVKKQYSACVAKFNVCPPWGGDRPDLCGYCAKIDPADKFFTENRCQSRQCVQVTKSTNWKYYLKNPHNN